MFQFVRRLFVRAEPPPRRFLFTFWDGQRWRVIDPTPARRALGAACPDLARVAADLMGDDEADRRIAEHQLLKAARVAFGVTEFRDDAGTLTGLTVTETLGVALGFLRWSGLVPPFAPEPRSAARG
ncbi:unnamed protein product [Gemmataceae bacterium]|nr:unnamed protein product [Gemmataceae bacterium]VTT97597.1 unnamed protein product [Gemmataceae bacterium]